jgi:Ni/Co efflux regulator RcnB
VSHTVWSKLDVHKIILRTLTMLGLIVGTTAIASASPATPLLDHNATAQTAQVERVDYSYNHHHYQHRSWDKGHHRWRYY